METIPSKININFEDIPSENKLKIALQKQLEHPFYDNADAFREEIKKETLIKAAKKYDEPFNPNSWTIEQLAKHAMAENYDQTNYIYGMYERLQKQEREVELLNLGFVEAIRLLQSALIVKPHNKDTYINYALEILTKTNTGK